MNPKFVKIIKELQFYSPLRKYFFPRYTYNLNPSHLIYLCQCIEKTRSINGAISEIGCAAGNTTIFLNKYMDCRNIKKDYYAIDTFSGFVNEDIEYEVENRGKTSKLFTGFQVNNKKWFDATMEQNKISRVRSIKADVNEFNFSSLGSLSFSLLDVDLYRPMKNALREIYKITSPGGIIVVDDCDSINIRWDGSDQAYKEFITEINHPYNIEHGKLGIIRKPL